jgi:hypothetical protein
MANCPDVARQGGRPSPTRLYKAAQSGASRCSRCSRPDDPPYEPRVGDWVDVLSQSGQILLLEKLDAPTGITLTDDMRARILAVNPPGLNGKPDPSMVFVEVWTQPFFMKNGFLSTNDIARSLSQAPNRIEMVIYQDFIKQKKAREKSRKDRLPGLLGAAQNLEKMGKRSAAIKFYDQIIADYPQSQEAEKAKSRVKELSRP